MPIESQSTALKTATFEPPFFEYNPHKLAERVGINGRYLTEAPRSEIIPEMGRQALEGALNQKAWSPENLDRLLVSTSYPYGKSPSKEIANLTEAKNVRCYDYYAACSGFLMMLCDLYINKDSLEPGKKIAIIASEQYSPKVNREHDINKFVFGDGASAFVFEWMKDLEIISCRSQILEDKMGLIKMPGVRLNSYPPETRCALPIPESETGYVEMDKKVLDWLKRKAGLDLELTHPIDLADEMLKESGHEFRNIDVLICHQSSGPALDALEGFAKEKGFSGRFVRTIRDYGNTSSDSIPRAWHFANQENPFTKGAKICLISFGAGLTVASALLEIKK